MSALMVFICQAYVASSMGVVVVVIPG